MESGFDPGGAAIAGRFLFLKEQGAWTNSPEFGAFKREGQAPISIHQHGPVAFIVRASSNRLTQSEFHLTRTSVSRSRF
jgi:hypothetical protein